MCVHVFVVFIWVEISFPHLEHGHVVLPVDLVGRRVEPVALLHVLVENAAALHVAQTELTEVELREPVTSKQSHISFYSQRSKVHKHISLERAYKQKNNSMRLRYLTPILHFMTALTITSLLNYHIKLTVEYIYIVEVIKCASSKVTS